MQPILFSIRDWIQVSYVSLDNNSVYHTEGYIWENHADNIIDLMKILMWHGIEIDKHIFF